MGKTLQKYGGSIRFWILVVACTYFAYALYYASSGLRESLDMLSDQFLYTSLSHNPWWWMVLFYGSEGVAGAVAMSVRIVAGVIAVYGAFLFWRKKDAAMQSIRKSFSAVLLLEAFFLLTYIPTLLRLPPTTLHATQTYTISATPEALQLYVTLIPCLAIVLIVPPLLLKLRVPSTIKRPSEKSPNGPV